MDENVSKKKKIAAIIIVVSFVLLIASAILATIHFSDTAEYSFRETFKGSGIWEKDTIIFSTEVWLYLSFISSLTIFGVFAPAIYIAMLDKKRKNKAKETTKS